MTPYYEHGGITIILGDCLERMAEMAESSVDAMVTDPPYGLSFMGKAWDHGVPGVPFWTEALRVAKPGAHLLAFGGTRTYHRLACAIEDAGWEIQDCIMWVYGSGFPKSLDVSKAIDKQGGGVGMPENDRKAFATELREKREAAGVSRQELASWFPQYAAVTNNWERQDVGFRVPNELDYQILVSRLGVSESWRLRVRAEDKRRLVAENLQDRRGDETVIGLGHSGKEWAATTTAARHWSGWGTALKPAYEPIIVARKPLVGTVAQNVQQFGTGAINVDGCRVEGPKGVPASLPDTGIHGWRTGGDMDRKSVQNGRWPANLIHDGSDEVLGLFPDSKGQQGFVGAKHGDRSSVNTYGDYGPRPDTPPRGDSGSAARFFYTAKASGADRGHEAWDALPLLGEPAGEFRNEHPTVKPLALMRYLCKLVTPPGGIVLDPFMGSGSTLMAAQRLGCSAIGIEIEQRYAEIATKRLESHD
jgi:DNA modification methylase